MGPYARDSIQRLSSLAIQGGSTLGTYSYSGRTAIQTALLNGVTESPSFDALRRKTLVHYHAGSTTLKKFEYVWNLADQRLLEKRHHASGTGDNYGLDSLYRTILVKAGVADPVAEHQNPGSQTVASTTNAAYNKVNSRSQVVVNTGGTPTTTTYTSDALEFYTSVGGIAQARDANGNLKDDGTRLYDYDYRNQLVKATRRSDGVVLGTYDYDAIGRRIAKTTAAGTRSFVWIGLQMAAEYDSQGLFSRRHLGATFGAVVAAAQRDVADLDTDGNTTEHLLLTPVYDGAFDCVGVLGPTGAVAESYVHTYEGQVTITNGAGQTISSSAVGWQQGYGRMYRDDEIGQLYTVHRHYNAALGRFPTVDPSGVWHDYANTGNGYGWAGNHFRNGFDPLGLDVWIENRSPGETWFHQSINVGDSNGSYLSITLAAWGLDLEHWGAYGKVVPDLHKGGAIEPLTYYSAPREVDAEIRRRWLNLLDYSEHHDGRWKYRLTGPNCRTFSYNMLMELLNTFGKLRPATPPIRTMKYDRLGNPIRVPRKPSAPVKSTLGDARNVPLYQ